MYCHNCGSKVDKIQNFCTSCGQTISDETTVAIKTKVDLNPLNQQLKEKFGQFSVYLFFANLIFPFLQQQDFPSLIMTIITIFSWAFFFVWIYCTYNYLKYKRAFERSIWYYLVSIMFYGLLSIYGLLIIIGLFGIY